MATVVRRGLGTACGNAMFMLSKAGLRPWIPHRKVTNATRPDHVQYLQLVPRGPEKEGGWHPTVVHSSGDLKWTIIRLQPNHGEIPSHFHTQVWDYFIPLSGKASVEIKTKNGAEKKYEMLPDTFLAVPPGHTHRVRNALKNQEFVFLIAQSPRSMYDFVASKDPTADADEADKVEK